MNIALKLCGLVGLLWLSGWQSAHADSAGQTLWYKAPATSWEGALPVGNGRIGAMVYGGVEKDTIQLNEDTFWAGGPHNNLNLAAKQNVSSLS